MAVPVKTSDWFCPLPFHTPVESSGIEFSPCMATLNFRNKKYIFLFRVSEHAGRSNPYRIRKHATAKGRRRLPRRRYIRKRKSATNDQQEINLVTNSRSANDGGSSGPMMRESAA